MMKEIEIPEGYEARIEGNKVVIAPKESDNEKIWKPSEEQMKALKLAYEDAFDCPESCVPYFHLKTLLADLEKLNTV